MAWRFLSTAAILFSSALLFAADPPAGKWTELTPPSVQIDVKQKTGELVKQPGAISAVAVSRQTGDLYAFVDGAGLYKSTDQGGSWKQLLESKGRCISTHSLLVDPMDGTRIFCLLSPAPSFLTLDGGKTWISVAHSNYSAIVDWNDPQANTMLARASGHEMWQISEDQGKTWKSAKNGQFGWNWVVGLFDPQTFIVCEKAINRSEAGINGPYAEVGQAKHEIYRVRPMVALKDHGYMLVAGGMGMTTDNGKTWEVRPTPAGTGAGPWFGKDESHIVVAAPQKGFFESRDAGKTWTPVVAFPFVPHALGNNMNHGDNDSCAFDPVHDTFYLCSHGQPVQKYQR